MSHFTTIIFQNFSEFKLQYLKYLIEIIQVIDFDLFIGSILIINNN